VRECLTSTGALWPRCKGPSADSQCSAPRIERRRTRAAVGAVCGAPRGKFAKRWAMLRARSGLALAAALCLCHATAYSRTDPESETEYAIVVTGTPLLNGTYADQHTQFLTRALHALGARCVVSITLGDERKDLLDGLAYAAQKASLILVTGGLGPTLDDIT